jgi:hypothetical protein
MSAGQAIEARLRGEGAALEDYAEKVRQARTTYLRGHRIVQAQETRWAHHPSGPAD